jgi:hypothetical protein
MSKSPATIIHSTEPLCWSGSQPEIPSIQSGQIGVMAHRIPVTAAVAVSAQKRRRSVLFELMSTGFLLTGCTRAERTFPRMSAVPPAIFREQQSAGTWPIHPFAAPSHMSRAIPRASSFSCSTRICQGQPQAATLPGLAAWSPAMIERGKRRALRSCLEEICHIHRDAGGDLIFLFARLRRLGASFHD